LTLLSYMFFLFPHDELIFMGIMMSPNMTFLFMMKSSEMRL